MLRSKALPGATGALGALLLASCVIPHVTPEDHPLKSASLDLKGPEVTPESQWWRGLHDPQLDRIMAETLEGNPTLDVALARLRVAAAEVEIRHAAILPQIDVDGSLQHQKLSGAYEIPQPYAGTKRSVGNITSSLDWTIDFAGKQRALISQARKGVDAASFDVAAARLALTGAAAETYVLLARAELQIRIAQSFVEERAGSLALARTRYTNNLDSQFDIRAAETLLAEAQKSLDHAEGDKALATHALAAIAGRGAGAYADVTPPVISLDAGLPLPVSLPANLLERRPDILAARSRIEAANAGRKAAWADFYPSVDLRAFLGVESVSVTSLLTGKALTYGIGPSVHIPIFEGGRLRGQYRGAVAEIDVATASYNEVVLQAVKEAADALSSIDSTAAQSADQRNIQNGLSETVRMDKVRVRTGLGTQLDILSSGEQLLEAQQVQADLDAQGLTERIRLLVAVGGDFDPRTPVNLAAAHDAGANQEAKP